MSLLRGEERPTFRQRLSIGLMTGGIVVLLGALVGAFVLVPVLLVQSSRRKEVEAAEARRRTEAKAPAEEKKAAPPKAEPPVAKTPKPVPPEPPKPARAESRQISVDPPSPTPPVSKDAAAVDAEGFIRHWLVLAPVRSAQQPFSGAQEIHKTQVSNEARMRPREGDRVSFPDRERVWQKSVSSEYFVDFQKIVGPGRGDDAIAYAVCYVHAPQAMAGLKLRMGSNDQAKVYLNGAQLLVTDKTRTLEKDSNTANDIQLQKGENLLVLKVVNEKGGWSGCVRFVDRKNEPVRSLQVSLVPK